MRGKGQQVVGCLLGKERVGGRGTGEGRWEEEEKNGRVEGRRELIRGRK